MERKSLPLWEGKKKMWGKLQEMSVTEVKGGMFMKAKNIIE